MSAMNLADWVRQHASSRNVSITHLQLQKLAFYAFGAASAFDLEDALGDVRFEAWKHGPVCREVYEAFKQYRREPLPVPTGAVTYPDVLTAVLTDVLDVYGTLSPYSIRDESHLEQPWIDAQAQSAPIEPAAIKRHFKAKFASGAVVLPAHLSGSWSSALDAIPSTSFQSLSAMAAALREPG